MKVAGAYIVRPWESIPTDGLVTTGDSGVDERMLTGESLPVSKGPGDKVFAGTLKHQGLLR